MTTPDEADYATLTDPTTLILRRRLPGPIERVWSYLTRDELRRQWLAAGVMTLTAGAPFTFTWRNDTLSETRSPRPDGIGEESRLESQIIAAEPPHRLAFTWEDGGDVTITLQAQGEAVLLTLTHRRFADRATLLGVAAGWHQHLDTLGAVLAGTPTPTFWAGWQQRHREYETRLPAA
ncbi:SRPBCC family protein [Achromobacter sp. GG226]|uniref:SRPBCC family protein n=1 Tax=Verticiella alkaliphila TaxID=2779529 RepID=UPI001C0D4859|nr:SRPBCC family protein [Verticiella sp. GG226]MBU4611418.1 SRPBCC family protein [Verticiella sp. GG226]